MRVRLRMSRCREMLSGGDTTRHRYDRLLERWRLLLLSLLLLLLLLLCLRLRLCLRRLHLPRLHLCIHSLLLMWRQPPKILHIHIHPRCKRNPLSNIWHR